ncbi:hypothetical protein FGADI_13021 [Fusarium gaditjirri]|uniref:Uncharacterized protein n=1 Tax=Fusarium gaditjirri TaxID=282569 RepID=A0A8H4WNC5_9HYPO|nr:hypothetical protein FGADI_13021 [Fusarium gaditjirri]
MNNNINPEAVKAAIMADLSRYRQEELPLSSKPKNPDQATYAPSGKNGTSHYSDTTKAVLESKWATKINDGESQSMEGLELEDSRPWAKGQTRKRLRNIVVDKVAPAIPASGGTISSYQSRGTRVQFNPPTPARWGPSPTETASQTNHQEPKLTAVHNGSSTTANATPANDTSCTPLVTKDQDEDGQDPVSSELLVYRKRCHLVPGMAEALSIVTNVAIKIRPAESDGILEVRNNSEGLRIHDALEIEKPILDGVFCTIKVKTRPFSEKLRFDTVSDAQGFKNNLIKLQKALLAERKEQNIGKSQLADNIEESNKAEDDGDLLMAASPVASTASETSIPIFNGISQQAPTADQEPLIMADDDWGTAANNNIPSLGHETVQLSQLLHWVLEQLAALGNHSGETMNGIEHEILEQALSHDLLHGCDDAMREEILAIIRSIFNVGCKLVSREFASGVGDTKAIETPVNDNAKGLGGAAAERVEYSKQVEDSNNRSVLGMPKGLGASRFAKKPAAYQGNFTGPIKY